MGPFRLSLILLVVSAFAALSPCASGQDVTFVCGPETPRGDKTYQPPRIPLSARAAKTWCKLLETNVKPLPDQTPFGEVLEAIKVAARGDDGGRVFEIFADPVSLKEAEVTMATPVTLPFVGQDEVPLDTYLKVILRSLDLERHVRDGVVIIEEGCDDCPEEANVTAQAARTWLILNEVVPLKFPEGTTLEDALKKFREVALRKEKGGRGLVIFFDRAGLKEAEATLASPVAIDLENAPLCTSLGLTLRPIGLAFEVGDDGMVVITSREEDPMMDMAEMARRYQYLSYDLFWTRYEPERQEREPRKLRGEKWPEIKAPSNRATGLGDGCRAVEPLPR